MLKSPRPAAPILFLDAASPETWVGLAACVNTGAARWQSSKKEAGVSLFQLAQQLLAEADLSVTDLRTIIFCEGPGSMLGVRLAAIAIRTWTRVADRNPPEVFAYRSLELVAASLLADGRQGPFAVISDARRRSWNRLEVASSGAYSEIARVPAQKMPACESTPHFVPGSFPSWQPKPMHAHEVDYAPNRLPELVSAGFGLLRPCPAPDAYLTEAPVYREWDPAQRPEKPAAKPK